MSIESSSSIVAWTSATALNTAVTIDASDYGTAVFTLNPTGTITGGILNFEGSDDEGVTWHAVIATGQFNALMSANTTFSMSGETDYIKWANIVGLSKFRIRLNPQITGTGTETIRLQASSTVVVQNMAISQANANALRTQLSDGNYNSTLTPTGQLNVNLPDATLCVTSTAATGVAVTLTLPAVAGQFHHINTIDVQAYNTAARTGGVTPVLVTTTNFPGSLVWTFASAGAIGTTDLKEADYPAPLKSSVVNTATTIVCPATTGVIWRATVTYFTAA